jgi:hypothetical protein
MSQRHPSADSLHPSATAVWERTGARRLDRRAHAPGSIVTRKGRGARPDILYRYGCIVINVDRMCTE